MIILNYMSDKNISTHTQVKFKILLWSKTKMTAYFDVFSPYRPVKKESKDLGKTMYKCVPHPANSLNQDIKYYVKYVHIALHKLTEGKSDSLYLPLEYVRLYPCRTPLCLSGLSHVTRILYEDGFTARFNTALGARNGTRKKNL